MKGNITKLKILLLLLTIIGIGQDVRKSESCQDAAKQTQSIVDSISPRVQQIEQEEPQYKQ